AQAQGIYRDRRHREPCGAARGAQQGIQYAIPDFFGCARGAGRRRQGCRVARRGAGQGLRSPDDGVAIGIGSKRMQRRYITVDVFTDRAFGGNPLAVVLDAAKLSTAQMQAIATEFNYSETTFVLPPADKANNAQVRIFTVRKELPFAGHPNVGTAFVLATRAKKPPARLLFEEIAGLVPVEIRSEGGKVVSAELTAPQPLRRSTVVSAEQAAACLSLSAFDIGTDRHAPQIVSVGT